jgi:hypothetical protein
MGFANTLSYKGITLYSLFDWKKGGDVYNLAKHWMFRDGRHAEVGQFNGLDGGPVIAESFFGSDGLYNVLVANNHFSEDGSFFMLREASLSYQFGKEQLAGILGGKLQAVKLSLIGRNLFTITDYTGFHPDVSGAGRGEGRLSNRVANNAAGSEPTTNVNGDPSLFAIDNFAYPVSKQYSLSIGITF